MTNNSYPKRPHQRKTGGCQRSLLLITLIAFTAGYLTALFLDFSALVKPFFYSKNDKNQSIAKESIKERDKTFQKPKLEFYTLLTKDNGNLVAIPSHDLEKKSDPVVANIASQVTKSDMPVVMSNPEARPTKESFLIQVAAFNRKEDADEMKATLLLSGFSVKIASVLKNDMTWYRVIIGPFTSEQDAAKAKITLSQRHKIQGIVRKA